MESNQILITTKRSKIKKLVAILFIVLNYQFSFSQTAEWKKREINTDFIKGVSFGFLVQGQTKYPNPYYGPERTGIYNDGSYHLMLDFYLKKVILGFQLSDDFLFLQNFENVVIEKDEIISGSIWKPRGYNDSFASLTRTIWISLGYSIFNELNLKMSVGFRNGPNESIFFNSKLPEEVALGYNFNSAENVYNTTSATQNTFSETDFSVSLNYPIPIYGNFGIVPELGYSKNHGGLVSGIGLKYTISE